MQGEAVPASSRGRAAGPEAGRSRRLDRLDGFSSWLLDVGTDTLTCTPELLQLHGVAEPASLRGESGGVPFTAWLALLPPHQARALAALRARVVATGQGGQTEYRARDGAGVRWLATVMAVSGRGGAEVTELCGYTFDVTARRRLEERHRDERESLSAYRGMLERIARGEPLPQILADGASWIERQLPDAGCAVLLLDRQEGLMRQVAAPTLPDGFAKLVDGLRVGEGFGPWGAAAARREPVIVTSVHGSGGLNSAAQELDDLGVRSLWVVPLQRTGGDEVIGLVALYQAQQRRPRKRELELVASVGRVLALAIEHESVNDRLRAEVNTDPLTGTLNRVRFTELITDRIASGTAPVAVICLEIDRFKPLRLTLGHHSGDQLLAEIGRRLLAVAGASGLVGHFSGDEFGLMVEAPSESEVLAVTNRIRESFRLPIVLDGAEFFLSCSLGIAYSEGADEAYGLVRAAAAAMHAARAEGFGHQRVYDNRIATQLLDRVAREADLRRALDAGELVMHYQPLLRVADRVWDRAETLVRWEHPSRGLVPPAEFIPLAEQTGLMSALGERVLELVIAQAGEWSHSLPGVQLSLNVSGMQLAHPRFAQRMLEMLEQAGLPPATLLLEVTESAILQDVSAAQAIITRLREAGIRTAIDDFGTGYSSLARLGELPITGVKIDRSFVAGLGNDERARAIFEAIAEIVRAHGLLIIAEGVEDERALEEVVAAGCDFVQGYHLCRPGPPDVIEQVLAAPVPERLTRTLGA